MLKAIHDRLLEEKPDDASHVASECAFCSPSTETASTTTTEGGAVVSKTYTEEEVAAKLAEATAAFEARIAEFEASKQESAIEAKVAEVRSELEAKLTEVQSALDIATAEKDAAKAELANVIAYLNEEKQAEETAAAIAARTEARVTAVKEVASFEDAYVEANTARWAGLSDESFQALLDDLRSVASKNATTIPATTAMTAAADQTAKGGSAIKGLSSLYKAGVDPRSL